MLLGVCPVFFFHAAAAPVVYTLSLHDALPISQGREESRLPADDQSGRGRRRTRPARSPQRRFLSPSLSCRVLPRSEEHTSELQSQFHLACRLLLAKKNDHPARWPPNQRPPCRR